MTTLTTKPFTIATWNVNSVRTRLPHLCGWLREKKPDVVLLQEIKTQAETFPFADIEDAGYHAVIHGQKSYNGVAILARHSIEDVTCGLPTFSEDPSARYIEALVAGKIRVGSVYVPNGESLKSEKFPYKMTFLPKLRAHLSHLLTYDEPVIIGGDYNIAPTDLDVYDPMGWQEEVLCTTRERQEFQALCNIGYRNALRLTAPRASGLYSWWDYRRGSWEKNQGLLIDHLLLSPQATDNLITSGVDTSLRGLEKPSDHTPVWCTLSLPT